MSLWGPRTRPSAGEDLQESVSFGKGAVNSCQEMSMDEVECISGVLSGARCAAITRWEHARGNDGAGSAGILVNS